MKPIIFFSDYFLPGFKAGGPIKSVSQLAKILSNEKEIYIFTRNYDLSSKKEPYKSVIPDNISEKDNYKIFYSSKISFYSIYKFINDINPNHIYLNSFFSTLSIRTVILSKIFFPKIKLILAPRGEFSPGALSIKKVKKTIFISFINFFNLYRNVTFHATDPTEKVDIFNQLRISDIRVAANLVQKYDNHYSLPHKEEGKLRVVFLSRIAKKKNLEFAVEVMSSMQITGMIYFDIYGTPEDSSYLNKCLRKANNDRIRYLGELNPVDIPEVLTRYHVFFLPTRGENFGHVIVEAISLGLLPILSNRTPWNDLSLYDAGWTYPLESKSLFIEKFNQLIEYNNQQFIAKSSNVSKYFEEKFDQSAMLSNYRDLFK